MDERDSELVLTLINEAGSAALKAALALQLANTASLMTTLVDKGLLTAEDTAVFATRTADMCSQSMGQLPEGALKFIGEGLHFYVDELLKMAEHGVPSVAVNGLEPGA